MKDINIYCFDTQHEHGERNRRCVKSKPFMAHIDEEIQNPDVTPETKKNIFLNLFTNKAWVPKWLLIDLLSKSEPRPINWFYIENITDSMTEATISDSNSNNPVTIEMSRDGVEWEVWCTTSQGSEYTIELEPGDKVYLRARTDVFIGKSFISGTPKIGGNILSLCYGDEFDGSQHILPQGVRFISLFRNNTDIIDASDLIIDIDELFASKLAYMFCKSSLVYAPRVINIRKISGSSAMSFMFADCTSLITAPELRVTTFSNTSCVSMFRGCTSLTTAPKLPVTTLANNCYQRMFEGCTSLINAPELPATTLADRCYSNMFNGCTSLTTAPELPATTLADRCYSNMFNGCTSLTTAPELPATTLANSCYSNMFQGCTSLTTAPELPATTLANYCYNSMFQGCTSLTTAPELPATALANDCYAGMFQGCTSLTTAPELPTTTLANNCYQSMFQDCTSLTTAPELPATTLDYGCYRSMFQGCTSLTTAPELPATTLDYGCYRFMFQGCTSLTTAPELPATTLADYCYQSMFQDCTSLTTAPELPATTLATLAYLAYECYASMFQGCTSLTTAPELPATTLTYGCYQSMFKGCTSLSAAPELPATTLNPRCYQSMFQGCTSLINAPELPATALAGGCYHSMFQDCTSLINAPKLPAVTFATTTINISDYYHSMFQGCTSLRRIICLIDYLADYTTTDMFTDWVTDVPESGIFVKGDSVTNWPRGNNGIPNGWIVMNEGQDYSDTIWYKSNDGNIVAPNASKFVDVDGNPVTILSNTINEEGVGEIKFSAPIGAITGGAFNSKTNLIAVWLPSNLKNTGNGTFDKCTALELIWMWDNVEVIGATFNNLTSLKNVYVNSINPPTLSANQASNLKTYGCSIHVPYESVGRYKTAENWAAVADQIIAI